MGRLLTALTLAGLLALLLFCISSAASTHGDEPAVQARGITRADFLLPGCSIRAIDSRQWLVRC